MGSLIFPSKSLAAVIKWLRHFEVSGIYVWYLVVAVILVPVKL